MAAGAGVQSPVRPSDDGASAQSSQHGGNVQCPPAAMEPPVRPSGQQVHDAMTQSSQHGVRVQDPPAAVEPSLGPSGQQVHGALAQSSQHGGNVQPSPANVQSSVRPCGQPHHGAMTQSSHHGGHVQGPPAELESSVRPSGQQVHGAMAQSSQHGRHGEAIVQGATFDKRYLPNVQSSERIAPLQNAMSQSLAAGAGVQSSVQPSGQQVHGASVQAAQHGANVQSCPPDVQSAARPGEQQMNGANANHTQSGAHALPSAMDADVQSSERQVSASAGSYAQRSESVVDVIVNAGAIVQSSVPGVQSGAARVYVQHANTLPGVVTGTWAQLCTIFNADDAQSLAALQAAVTAAQHSGQFKRDDADPDNIAKIMYTLSAPPQPTPPQTQPTPPPGFLVHLTYLVCVDGCEDRGQTAVMRPRSDRSLTAV